MARRRILHSGVMADESPNKGSRGRPTKRCAEVDALIYEALELGLSRNRAADYGGIARSTMDDWLVNDPDFSERCHKAESKGIALHARRLAGAVELPSGTASAAIAASKFFLATHDRENFAEKVQVEHSGAITLTDLMRRVIPIDEEPSI